MTNIDILKLCHRCLTKPCANGYCPHSIEARADKIETDAMTRGYMPIELSDTQDAILRSDKVLKGVLRDIQGYVARIN